MTKVSAIIVASGRGTRFAPGQTNARPKQYHVINGSPVLSWTIRRFMEHSGIDEIQVVINSDDTELYEEAISSLPGTKLKPPVFGGATRQDSVRSGLEALTDAGSDDLVLIHDAARPLVSSDIIDAVLKGLSDHDAVTAAVPVADTMRHGTDDGVLTDAVDRNGLWVVQTPQAFRHSSILEAHRKAAGEGRHDFTDDTLVYQWFGKSVAVVNGARTNLKITREEDMAMVAYHLSGTPMETRVGTGYDVHAFDDGDAVILGGISIPHDRKLKGHSDADVGLHALTDAILGALGDGDIGTHFPPSDPQWKGAASDQFLIDAVRRVSALGGRIIHLDLTLICEAPKIGPHRDAMREQIAGICSLPVHRISVKATTSERLGFTGRREGIAAIGTATLSLPQQDD
ncbi:bifunctional 2-C-methyl-D-erythritol 4-phosphate cytidylyltransferase/2-C-methyl-D-erythritol 2,4-cyclodiphosphate synthase [Coralliovum pocilloporae]|uniref:bifunctional 2-C-methyl-D-erythritol 4-phosphate cytidylyltransferase/2-C-methyl-D-erythritol 2,4-cyclodiphosphate synthase n=1 Tax=Coralliovum pocilloporae TaxID=3066369 RepID=UPI003306FCAB